MIKKLRRKFIVVAIISVTLVISFFMGIIIVRTYRSITSRADDNLELIAKYDMLALSPPYLPKIKGLNPETRFFFVIVDNNGRVVQVNIENIASINVSDAVNYVNKVANRNKDRGYLSHYRYFIDEEENYTTYLFLDCSREINVFNSFLQISILFSSAGLLVFFFLIYLFSGLVIEPIAENYRKQKQFITDASHELKTPLTIIGANADILEMEYGENEQIKAIKNQVERLATLTDRLVFLARLNERESKILMTDFSLTEVLEDIIHEYQAVVDAQGKYLETDITPNVTLHGDNSSITKMLRLLLDNAIKYSNDGGLISITLKQEGKHKKIIMSNTTNGIEKRNLDKLFDRFYRPDSSRARGTGGHGIGLAVVKSIVDLHKGKVTAYSTDGITINFVISLP